MQISASLAGNVTWTSSKEKFRVSHSLPTMFTTTLDRSTAYLMASASRMEKSRCTIWPRSPITLRCWRAFSLHRLGRIILLPLLPMWFTTYRPRKPELPKTVDVIPLFRHGEGRGGGQLAAKG